MNVSTHSRRFVLLGLLALLVGAILCALVVMIIQARFPGRFSVLPALLLFVIPTLLLLLAVGGLSYSAYTRRLVLFGSLVLLLGALACILFEPISLSRLGIGPF